MLLEGIICVAVAIFFMLHIPAYSLPSQKTSQDFYSLKNQDRMTTRNSHLSDPLTELLDKDLQSLLEYSCTLLVFND